MAVSGSPQGQKTDPVLVCQLAWCGAVTASPSSAQSLSVSHSLLVCISGGQAGVHSFLVSLSERFTDGQTHISTLKPQPLLLSLFPIQGYAELVTPSFQLLLLPVGKACKPSDSSACPKALLEHAHSHARTIPCYTICIFDFYPKTLLCKWLADSL